MDENGSGRPSKYDPKFCDLLIKHMEEGLSFESFAAVAEVNRDTLYQWEKAHPEFSDAAKRARDAALLFWEKLGIDHIINQTDYESDGSGVKSSSTKSLNSPVWIFNMKNRFKWRDKQPDENDEINIKITLAERMASARARVNKK